VRVLALDYGSARCGCAISDPTGTVATPLQPVARPDTRRGMAALAELAAEHGVRTVVVGLPIGLSGDDTQQTTATREFANRLAKRLGDGVAVELYDERFTTRMAALDAGAEARAGAARAAEDSRAAAHLLDGWLAARHRGD
jgi:putative Holliday junction resolvase